MVVVVVVVVGLGLQVVFVVCSNAWFAVFLEERGIAPCPSRRSFALRKAFPNAFSTERTDGLPSFS